MGEEENKTVEKKQAATEEAGKKGGQLGKKVQKKEEDKKPDKNQNQAENPKKEDKKAAGSGGDDSKDAKEQAPPSPPQEIVLKVYMHCEGCARKVRRSLQGFDGVEDVITDCKNHKVVVKREKADPLKVLARVQKKSHRQVELLSPVPKPQPEEPPEKEPHHHQAEEKKEEPQVIRVVLKVHMHCEACSQEIKKSILRMKGVESAEEDLKSSEVSVKGVFEVQKLVNYVYKRTGKHAALVKQDPPEKKEKDQKAEDGKEEKKAEEGGDEKKAADQEERKENGKESSSGAAAANKAEEEATMEENAEVVELKRKEYCYYPAMYPPKYAPSGDLHSSANTTSTYSSSYQYYDPAAYLPQLFSDENPNACSIM